MNNTVFWFRTKGLRLHDNPSLLESIENADSLRCIFILDPYFAASAAYSANKWRFLLQCLEDLDQSLRKYNSRLFVVKGQPPEVLPRLFKEWKTSCFSFEEDPEPFGHARDSNILSLCAQLQIRVISHPSHTLYPSALVLTQNAGAAPLTYRHFLEVIQTLPAPQPPCAPPQRLPHTPIEPKFRRKYDIPTPGELGIEISDLWKGGETEALQRFSKYLERKSFRQRGRRKLSSEMLIASDTGLSPYLRFGCLSVRLYFYKLREAYQNFRNSEPSIHLYSKILWREFFYLVAGQNPNFDKMAENSICLQIPWDVNVEATLKWANGQTGFPFIDAIMIQLKQEGWIHHLARHAVATFLTRGQLWISWEEGLKVFEELLLDADLVTNAGSWLWYSGSSFFKPFFHALCPIRFGRKSDPEGEYIRKYVTALQHFPTQFIHEPWKASMEVQTAANCVIGHDYPVPMLCHVSASKVNSERMRQVVASLAKPNNFS